MEEQPLSAVAEAWRLTLVSVPIALVLWLSAFLAARAGPGGPALFVVLYAPLALLGTAAAVGGGMLLHLAYAACADLAQAGRVRAGWLVALAALHYACLALAFWALGGFAWRPRGAAAWAGLVLFLGWQALLAAPLLRRRAPGGGAGAA